MAKSDYLAQRRKGRPPIAYRFLHEEENRAAESEAAGPLCCKRGENAMTCIVGITDGKRIVMGADSAGSSPDNPEIYDTATSKLWKTGEYVIGICGSYRAGQLARWEMNWPEPPEVTGPELESFMVRVVVASLRQTLQNAAFTSPEERSRVAQFLVGVRGTLFSIGGDFSAVSMRPPWMAIGSGRFAAYGALQILGGLELELEDKVRRALAAAATQTANVREPFHVLSVGG
jgi:20S proteasome alpha/beta subunit